jgi:microcompartment protein CcmK/EutM
MLLARVVGTVVASRKEESMEGLKLLLLRQITAMGEATGTFVVASDAVGAGVGEVVLFASGSSARQTDLTKDRPCDAVVMAIVDSWDLDDRRVYDKSGGAGA